VDNPARLAYQETQIASFNNGGFVTAIFFNEVPAGKRLVIEHVSVEAQVPIGQTARASFVSHLGQTSSDHSLVMNSQGVVVGSPANRESFVASQLVRFYEDGGTGPGINVSRSDSIGGGFAVGTISGYLVEVP
jgi:hypothetical protein